MSYFIAQWRTFFTCRAEVGEGVIDGWRYRQTAGDVYESLNEALVSPTQVIVSLLSPTRTHCTHILVSTCIILTLYGDHILWNRSHTNQNLISKNTFKPGAYISQSDVWKQQQTSVNALKLCLSTPVNVFFHSGVYSCAPHTYPFATFNSFNPGEFLVALYDRRPHDPPGCNISLRLIFRLRLLDLFISPEFMPCVSVGYGVQEWTVLFVRRYRTRQLWVNKFRAWESCTECVSLAVKY